MAIFVQSIKRHGNFCAAILQKPCVASELT